MNNEVNTESVDHEVKLKIVEEDNEKLKQALTEVSKQFNNISASIECFSFSSLKNEKSYS